MKRDRDSKPPTTRLVDFLHEETRYTALERSDHDRSEHPDFAFLWDVIGAYDGPLVLARGMRTGSVVDDADEAELLRRKPDARVVHFDEAGHSIQGDMPVELAALLERLRATP